jgi:uncharacterized protein (TIGR02757 family)
MSQQIDNSTRNLLINYAERYETEEFIDGDPSWFMHQVRGNNNQEAMAFIAASLSYGSRQQFMKKIRTILEWTDGDVDAWVREGRFGKYLNAGDNNCFYRLYTCDTMYRFLSTYQQLLAEYGLLGEYVRRKAEDGLGAVDAICRYFSRHGISVIIPKDTQSACKRVCMFLRWMVRSGSPVDLGLWSEFIDRRTLIIPLDTHVLQQSVMLGLSDSKTASMHAARRLTGVLASIFPDDPLKGDFALFGHGVNT